MDEELQRLESVLGAYPDDRALPDLERIFDEAGVDASLLETDDRARKLLLDAITTRPLGAIEDVREIATEVELLVLEVRQLADRLSDNRLEPAERARVDDRLAWARQRLQEVDELL